MAVPNQHALTPGIGLDQGQVVGRSAPRSPFPAATTSTPGFTIQSCQCPDDLSLEVFDQQDAVIPLIPGNASHRAPSRYAPMRRASGTRRRGASGASTAARWQATAPRSRSTCRRPSSPVARTRHRPPPPPSPCRRRAASRAPPASRSGPAPSSSTTSAASCSAPPCCCCSASRRWRPRWPSVRRSWSSRRWSPFSWRSAFGFLGAAGAA